MDSDRDKNRTIVLVAIGILLAITVFIYALWIIFGGDDENTSAEPVTFPESGLRTDQGVPRDTQPVDEEVALPEVLSPLESSDVVATTDWRDEVVTIAPQEVPEAFVPPPTYVAPEPVSDEFQTEDNFLPDESELPIPERRISTKPDIVQYSYTVPVYDELKKKNFKDCGDVDLPTVGLMTASQRVVLANDSVIECFGEAIAGGCDSVKMYVTQGFQSGYFYIVETNGGECGFGASRDERTMDLCEIVAVMDAATNVHRTFSEIEKLYATDPGETFLEMYYSIASDTYKQRLVQPYCESLTF